MRTAKTHREMAGLLFGFLMFLVFTQIFWSSHSFMY